MDALLGKVSDTEIAGSFNISISSVGNRRRKFVIPRCPQQNFSPPPAMGGWNRHEWNDAHLALLGTIPDHELAATMGIDKCTVGRKRNSLGIPSFEFQTRLITWTTEMDVLLGTDYDRIIAGALNISAPAVAQRRYKLGTPSYQSKHRLIPEGASCQDPESLRFYLERRRAMVNGLPHTLTLQDWERACAFFGYKCAYCQEQLPLTQDHLIAVSNGGGYTAENIIPSCGSCNSAKYNHPWQEWVHLRFADDKAQAVIKRFQEYQCSMI